MPVHSEAPILPRHPSRQCQAHPDEPTSKALCGHAGTRARGRADLGGGQLVLQLLSVVHLCCHLLTLAVDFCRVLRTYLLAGEAMGAMHVGVTGRRLRGATRCGRHCMPASAGIARASAGMHQVCGRYARFMHARLGRPSMHACAHLAQPPVHYRARHELAPGQILPTRWLSRRRCGCPARRRGLAQPLLELSPHLRPRANVRISQWASSSREWGMARMHVRRECALPAPATCPCHVGAST